MNATANAINPFVGPEPFGLNNREFFFGRESEASQLLSLIVAHQVFLLYAQSGAGKTSLVKANLIPSLEERGFEILGPARVQGLIVPPDFGDDENIFVLNVLRYVKPGHNDSQDQTTDLRHWLKRDLSSRDDDEQPPRIIIFDQFEELFTFYGERWQDRKKFFEQLAEVLYNDPLLRVLFVMREDYIAELAQYEHLMPGKLQMRLRLERLRKPAATAAIREPLKKVNRHEKFATEIANQVTAELLKIHVQTADGQSVEKEGEFVEAVQLQVVCHRMWASRWANVPPDQEEVADAQRVSLDDIDWALTVFYEERIRQVAQTANVSEDELRRWFQDKLITPAKTRGMVFSGKDDAAGLPNAAVRALENLHLIRGDNRAGARWYELTHDRFIEPIIESNRRSFGWFETLRLAVNAATRVRIVAAVWFILLIIVWLAFLETLPARTELKLAQHGWIRENLKAVETKLGREEKFLEAFKQIQASYEKQRASIKDFDENKTRNEWKSIIQQFDSLWTGKGQGADPIRKHDTRLLRKQASRLINSLVVSKIESSSAETEAEQLSLKAEDVLVPLRTRNELDRENKTRRVWLQQKKQTLENEEKSLRIVGIRHVLVYATLPALWCLSLFVLIIYLANARGKLRTYVRTLRSFQSRKAQGELAGRVASSYGWVRPNDDQGPRPVPRETIDITDPLGWVVTRRVAPALTMVGLIVLMLVEFRVSLLGISLTKQIGWNRPTVIVAGLTLLTLISSILFICNWIISSARPATATTGAQSQRLQTSSPAVS